MLSSKSSQHFVQVYRELKRDQLRRKNKGRLALELGSAGSVNEVVPSQTCCNPTVDILASVCQDVSFDDSQEEVQEDISELPGPWAPELQRRRSSIDPRMLVLPMINASVNRGRRMSFSDQQYFNIQKLKNSSSPSELSRVSSEESSECSSENDEDCDTTLSRGLRDFQIGGVASKFSSKLGPRSAVSVSTSSSERTNSQTTKIDPIANQLQRHNLFARRKSSVSLSFPIVHATAGTAHRRLSTVNTSPSAKRQRRKSSVMKEERRGPRRLSIIPPPNLAVLQEKYMQTLLEGSSSCESDSKD